MLKTCYHAAIQREIARRGIMQSSSNPSLEVESLGIGQGLVAKGQGQTSKPVNRRVDDKSQLRCTHCGGTRHKDDCFKLVGYPEVKLKAPVELS